MPSSFALAAAEALSILGQAWLLAWILTAVIVDGAAVTDLVAALAALLMAWGLRAGIVSLRSYLTARASTRTRQSLRRELYSTLASAGPLYAGQAGTGNMTSGLIEQVDKLDPYYARYLPQSAVATLVPLFILVAVFPTDWLAGLLLLIAAPLIPGFMILIGMGAEQVSRQQQDALARLSGVFYDRLRGLDTLKRFGAEKRESSRIGELSEQFRARTMRVLRIAFLSSAILEFFSAVAIASLAIYIGLGLLDMIDFGAATSLTLFKGLFILLLAPEFFNPMRTLAQFWHDRAGALAAAGALRELLAAPPARPEPVTLADQVPDHACSIHIQNLRHGFSGRPEVLRGLELTIRPGQKVLIQGPSGSGKSTLLGLLAGFSAPQQGRILIDDTDLADFSTSQLSALRGYLGQRPFLLPGSIADNIRFGQPQAEDEQVAAAARQAGVSAFADPLPQGLQTRLGSDGVGVSGGQARRIALARILLRPYPLLLLDEPTASLDEQTEREIWSALDRAHADTAMTMVCVSHSPIAREWADRTVSLNDGQLEDASHG